jgi:CPA2 family monovalent cation:H+ antiporter-2
MEFEILQDLVLIFGVSAVLVFILGRLNIPSIVGFLIAGVILGPHGFGIIKDMHEIEIFAEIGVILLLFTIGIEFSLQRLLKMKKIVLAGGGSYVLFAIGVTAAVFYLMIEQLNESIFFGFLIALSSTAIVMKMLAEKGESDSPHGRVMIGVLIFQDLCVVPLMLLTPALSGDAIDIMDIALQMAKAGAIVAAVLLSARWIVPGLLHQVVHTKSRELFVIVIILLCIGIALLTSKMGLSLALGAFIAGLIISESEYAHQATSDILPFKDSFIGLFFVSVGMLMNIGYMSDHFLKIVIAVSLIFILKAVIGVVSSLLIKTPLRTSIHAGIGLAQVGEFSFVLAVAGRSAGIITEEFYQIFLSSSVVTMMMTPFMMMIAPVVSRSVTSSRVLKRLIKVQRVSEGEGLPRKREGHVIIIGFGLNGRHLARVLKEADIPYVVLEMNIDTVIDMKKKREPIYYGDGTSKEILNKLSIQNARLLVVAISDPASTRRIVSMARRENPDLYIIVRTRYLAEVDDLRALGADEVIPEEFETAVEIFSRVLNKYNFPSNVILDMVDKVREDSYTALRSVELQKRHLFEKCEWLPNIEIDGYRIPDSSHLAEKGIAELRIREKTGITIIAVRRGAEVFTHPSPAFHFNPGDIILFTGGRKEMMQALEFFRGNG